MEKSIEMYVNKADIRTQSEFIFIKARTQLYQVLSVL